MSRTCGKPSSSWSQTSLGCKEKVRFMAALSGSVLMSASALLGAGGVKLTFHPGQEIQVAIFVTDTFKAEEPGNDCTAT